MLSYNPSSGLRLAKTVFEALFLIRPCARYPNFFDLKNNKKTTYCNENDAKDFPEHIWKHGTEQSKYHLSPILNNTFLTLIHEILVSFQSLNIKKKTGNTI